MKRSTILTLSVALLGLPVAAYSFYKPSRVLVPELVAGITCHSSNVCLEDDAKIQEANALYADATRHVETTVAGIRKPPRVVFCSSSFCYRSFGFSKSAAHAVGVSGIVVGPRGWAPHFVRHEFIHHLQAERFGVIGYFRRPTWLIEGMAYSMSGDPRELLSGPYQAHRERFERWRDSLGSGDFWDAAAALQ